jgi:hypothetical protein
MEPERRRQFWLDQTDVMCGGNNFMRPDMSEEQKKEADECRDQIAHNWVYIHKRAAKPDN